VLYSSMSRRKPTRARMRGLRQCIGPLGKAGNIVDDAKVSRSSRGMKYITSGKSCHRTEAVDRVPISWRRVIWN
jgi:hypothetical protein